MELNVSLSGDDYPVAPKKILFGMIRAAAAHDTGSKKLDKAIASAKPSDFK